MDSKREHGKAARNLSYLATFLVSFFLMSQVIQAVAHHAKRANEDLPRDLFEVKLRAFEKEKDKYTAVFIGPSTVYRQIDPVVFDERIQKVDPEFKSFNFGLPAMNWAEAAFLLDWIERVAPGRLKYVFLEPQPDFALDHRNLNTGRATMTHDWHHTKLVVSEILKSEAKVAEKLRLTTLHLRAFVRNASNMGQLARVLGRAQADSWPLSEVLRTRGNIALDDDKAPDVAERRIHFLANVETFLHQRDLPPGNRGAYEVPGKVLLIRDLLARIRSMGARPILTTGPTLDNPLGVEPRLAHSALFGCPTISFAHPRKFPELFLPENRWDFRHLNQKGARIYSRMLAEALLSTWE